MTSDVDHLFESVSRMASGTSTPLRQAGRDCLPAPTRGVGAATASGAVPAATERDQPLSAEEYVSSCAGCIDVVDSVVLMLRSPYCHRFSITSLIARLTGRIHTRSAQSSQVGAGVEE